jgi:hypothetical protein
LVPVPLQEIPMVNVVNYGALEARPTNDKRKSLAVFGGVAFLALLVVAAVLNVNSASKTTELYEYNHVGAHSDDYAGTVEPSTLSDDQVASTRRCLDSLTLTDRQSGEGNLVRPRPCLGRDR